MQLIKVKARSINKYLSTFVATYKNKSGKEKDYEIVSRDKNLTFDKLSNDFDRQAEAVSIIVFNDDKTKILLEKEFRLSCNSWVYNFPGGLIDTGEDELQAAIRELREETGLRLYYVDRILPKSYAAIGMSDELIKIVICRADGELRDSEFDNEEISSAWYTKEDVRKLFDSDIHMCSKVQSFLYLWAFE